MNQRARSPSLKSLLTCQFFGAFNDNAWKLIVTLLAIRSLEAGFTGTAAEFQSASQMQTTLAFSVLTLPLILFSLPAGLLADRLSKTRVLIVMKFVEVLLMASAMLTLLWAPESVLPPLVILGLMGAQSAFFSPAKYGILPELLPHERLSEGNALIELWTFLAIILGTALGGALLEISGNRVWLAGGGLLALSVTGFAFALRIPRVPPARAEGRLIESILGSWQAVRADRVLGLAVAGSVVYWTAASLLGQNVFVYARSVLTLSDTRSGVPLAVFGIGIALGAVLAARISASKVEYGLIPMGAILMAGVTLLLAWTAPGFFGLIALTGLLGIASGLLVVPLDALIQWKSPARRRGGVIALTNVFVFSGTFLGSVGATALASLGFSPRAIFFAAALAVALGTAWALWLLPDALLRLGLILTTLSIYRLTVIGRKHVPQEGGALLIPNHVSLVDGLMLIASIDRPVRFLVDQIYFNHWFFKPFMKSMGMIPISASGGPRVILRALRDAGRFLDDGHVVCIFPEGQMTRTGALLPFRRGMERIIKDREAPIIPVYLDRLWGSVFSYERGRFLFKLPKRIPYPVTVAFGPPLKAGTPLAEIRQAVQELSSEAWEHRKESAEPLHAAFVRMARRRPMGMALADWDTPRVGRLKALAGAVAIARALKEEWAGQERVGILLPPSVAGALVNVAASLSGRVSVNLNYTAGKEGLESAVRQAGLKSVLTSRTFLEKAQLNLPGGARPIWMEEVGAGIGWRDRLAALIAACLLPIRWLEGWCGMERRPGADDPATVIFSSGSTGEPKGVILTHFNVQSNVEAVAQVMRASPRDRLLGILPFFHSFGYMSLWFSFDQGVGMPVHPNPLDAGAVGELIRRHRVTILLCTPTFLQLYMRRCTPAQFGSLRMVIAGAEKLQQRLALAFEDQFGIAPLEGYGCTECSPVIAVNIPDFRSAGYFQAGAHRGFAGHPLPGVSVRIADPESSQPVPAGTPGMLLVKGPNVMKGYLDREDLTRKVLVDGWYVTGDIATLNEDGFLQITDRLSRFSKIGGEMVPHGRVEEALHQAAGAETQIFAVTTVPDERKGESLAVVHTFNEGGLPELLEKLAGMGLPNLFIPRKDRFMRVDRLPVLGTGKINLREIGRMARARFGKG